MFVEIAVEKFAAGLIGRPLAISPEAAATAFEFPKSPDLRAASTLTSAGDARRLYSVDGGVAAIQIHGETVSRPNWLTELFGLPSYHGISHALSAAVADRDVRGVLLDFDSPGGEFAGAAELAAQVRRASATKPIVAFVDSCATSAAYVIAAAATRVIVTMSATVGSIGVVYMHLDRSQAMKDRGLKPTILHAGAFKADGNSMQPLGAEARKRIQSSINEAHNLIVESVGRHRPNLGAAGARATEAGLFLGERAVAAGLADAIGTTEAARTYLLSCPSSSTAALASRAPVSAATAYENRPQSLKAEIASAYPSPPAPPSPPCGPAAASPNSTNIGETVMSQPEPLAALSFPPLPPGHFYSQQAMKRAATKLQRKANANALVARQLKGQTVEDSWTEALAKAGALPPENTGRNDAAAKPAASSASADRWGDIIANLDSVSAFRECYK
jgi:signal peptide peptidase SppA